MLQAVGIDLQPFQSPVAISAAGDVHPGMNRDVFTQEQCHATGIVEVNIKIVGWFNQHALKRDIQQVTTPFLVATLHKDFCNEGDAVVSSAFCLLSFVQLCIQTV